VFRVSRASIARPPLGNKWELLKRVGPGLRGADTDSILEIGDKDLAVADLGGLSLLNDGVDRLLQLGVVDGAFLSTGWTEVLSADTLGKHSALGR